MTNDADDDLAEQLAEDEGKCTMCGMPGMYPFCSDGCESAFYGAPLDDADA